MLQELYGLDVLNLEMSAISCGWVLFDKFQIGRLRSSTGLVNTIVTLNPRKVSFEEQTWMPCYRFVFSKENIVTMKNCHITSITTAVLSDSGHHPWEEFTQYQDLELIKLTSGVDVSIENLKKFDIKCVLLDHWEGVDG